MNAIQRLHEAIENVCPIQGVCVEGNRVTRIDHAPESTAEQRAAADAVVSSFDWSEQAARGWQRAKARREALGFLDRDDTVGSVLRLLGRDLYAQLNLVRAAVGLPPLSEAETRARLQTLAAGGWGDAGEFGAQNVG